MYFAYSILLALALLVTLPWWLVRMARSGKYRAGLAERLGRIRPGLRATGPDENCIWIHAVSVGEVLAVSGLIAALPARFPGWRVVVSTTTLSGQQLARSRFGEADVCYLPLDLPFALRPLFTQLRPRLLVLAETEFWPNLLAIATAHGIRVAVVNARISDRSFPRYRRVRGLLKNVLAAIDLFLAQSEADRDRLLAIGAPGARLQVSGNLKFDALPAATEPPLVPQVRSALAPAAPVIVCGSTVAGEEEILIAAFRQVRAEHPDAVMVLAVRHPERFDGVAQLLTRTAASFIRRSAWRPEASATLRGTVLLLDSIGELAALYALATVAFVGGSLVPRGGHNILEAARFGKPIVVGPHTGNFRDIVGLFTAPRAIRVVTAETLAGEWLRLLARPEERQELGDRALAVFQAHQGATARTLDALEVLLWMPASIAGRYREAR